MRDPDLSGVECSEVVLPMELLCVVSIDITVGMQLKEIYTCLPIKAIFIFIWSPEGALQWTVFDARRVVVL